MCIHGFLGWKPDDNPFLFKTVWCSIRDCLLKGFFPVPWFVDSDLCGVKPPCHILISKRGHSQPKHELLGRYQDSTGTEGCGWNETHVTVMTVTSLRMWQMRLICRSAWDSVSNQPHPCSALSVCGLSLSSGLWVCASSGLVTGLLSSLGLLLLALWSSPTASPSPSLIQWGGWCPAGALRRWLSTWVLLSFREHLTLSGGTFACHSWGWQVLKASI